MTCGPLAHAISLSFVASLKMCVDMACEGVKLLVHHRGTIPVKAPRVDGIGLGEVGPGQPSGQVGVLVPWSLTCGRFFFHRNAAFCLVDKSADLLTFRAIVPQ